MFCRFNAIDFRSEFLNWFFGGQSRGQQVFYNMIIRDLHFTLFNPIQTGRFGNFVRLGGVECARAVCLFISQQFLAIELSFKFV